MTVIAREVLLVLSGWKPGMLLNILQCTRQPSQPRVIQPKMPVLARLGNLDLDDLITCQLEWTERVTDLDSEKAVLCSLISQALQ